MIFRSARTRANLRGVVQLAALVAVLLTARASFADHYRVPSGSMEPAVHVGDHIVVSKSAYGLRVPFTDAWLTRAHAPQRGDVVVLVSPEDHETILLKRIVAVAGDRVEVKDGHTSVDGHLRTEPWASFDAGTGPDFGPAVVPPGKVLVLGDNRGNSHDGREIGWVDTRHVLGRAVAVVARDGGIVYEPL